MRKLNKPSLRLALLRVARVLLGLTLVATMLWTTVPSAASDSEPICHLACCAGKALHRAGSCMNGSCHAFIGGHGGKSDIHFQAPPEKLCGLEKVTKAASWLAVTQAFAAVVSNINNQSDLNSPGKSTSPNLSTIAVTKPCQPECGGTGSGFTNPNRQRNPSSCAFADRPRPPSLLFCYDVDLQRTQALNPSRRRGAPRGPPLALS